MATNPKQHESAHIRKRRKWCPKCGDARRTLSEGSGRLHQRCRPHNTGEIRGKTKGRKGMVVGAKKKGA